MSAISTTVYELLADNLPDRSATTLFIDGSSSMTYGDAATEVEKVAGWLVSSGVQPGDRVVVNLRKGAREAIAMLAVAKVGAVIVNVNIQWTAKQLIYVATDSGAKVLIMEASSAKAVSGENWPDLITHVLVSAQSYDATADGPACAAWGDLKVGVATPDVVRLDTELAAIIYTSGSTGAPKGVMLTHRNIVTGARAVARYLRLSQNDRLISVLPYSFDYGLNQLMTMLLVGGSIVHQPVPMATEIISAIKKHDVTGFAAVPPLWNQIVRLLAEKPTPLPSLRYITNSGGSIPLATLQQMPKVFPGVDVYLMYGLTEAFRSTFLPPEKFLTKMGAIGRQIPSAEIYVIKPGEGLARPGEEGELVHRGPLISQGYWGKPDATNAKLRPCPELAHLIGDEPVLYSGDTVRLDADGDIWFVGRRDSLIKSSGFRLSPDEVEDLAFGCGLIADVIAFGVDDEDRGQVVHLAITPLPGFTEPAFLQYCRSAMPHYMVPAKLHLFDKPMPRTASGKLERPEVVKKCRLNLASVGAAG